MNKSQNQNSKGIYFLLGSLIGLIIYLCIYGPDRLSFTNDTWIYNLGGDISQHYLGWIFYRNGDWQFPLGLTNQMTYPNSVSVIFTDSIPIMAIFFKLFRKILPDTFQYFGLYGLLCFILQGGMGSLITSKFHPSKLVCSISSFLFVFSPVMLFRMYKHTALSSHFLILIAIYLWFCLPELNWKKALLYWSSLGILCAGIHIYFLPIVGIILVAFCIRQIINKNLSFLQCIAQIFSFCCSAIITIWIEGGFYGKSDVSTNGLGLYNANLNTLYNGMSINYLLPNFEIFPGQSEGYGCLGFGILLLFIIELILHIILHKKETKEHTTFNQSTKALLFSTLWICIIPFALAVNPKICFNQHELLILQLPESLNNLLSIFRCSGRFIWIVVYVIIVYAVQLAVQCKKTKIIVPVLVICSILQIIDLQYFYKNSNIPEREAMYESEAWDYLAEKYKKVNIIGELDEATYLNFGWYMAKNHFSTTQFHIARLNSEEIQQEINVSISDLKSGNPSEDTIYIFNNTFYYNDYGLHLYDLDGLYIGISEQLNFIEELDSPSIEYQFPNSMYLINGEDTADGRVLHSDGISFGPYMSLSAYQYLITVKGQSLDHLNYDAFSGEFNEKLSITPLITTENELQYILLADKDYSDIEIRFFNESSSDVIIQHVYIMPYSK